MAASRTQQPRLLSTLDWHSLSPAPLSSLEGNASQQTEVTLLEKGTGHMKRSN
jgi:hypothetical protein